MRKFILMISLLVVAPFMAFAEDEEQNYDGSEGVGGDEEWSMPSDEALYEESDDLDQQLEDSDDMQLAGAAAVPATKPASKSAPAAKKSSAAAKAAPAKAKAAPAKAKVAAKAKVEKKKEVTKKVVENKKSDAKKNVNLEVQKALVATGEKLTVDGKFGPKSVAALKRYQKKNKLPESGKADSKTLAKMGIK